MNEVKKSLDAVSGFTSDDLDEVKQGVMSGKRRQKRRNPLPAAITVFVAAAVLFFAFNVLQDGFSPADEEEFEINELIYDFMLRNESLSNGDGGEPTDEMKQTVLQNMLLVDALIDYAKTIGYSEDMEAIEKTVANERDAFYADMDNEGEERKKIILQGREDTLGMSMDTYYNVLLKWTSRAVTVNEWLAQHPQENPKTHGEVLALFQAKYERSIADFMEQKSIPPFDLSVMYEVHEGTVAAIRDDGVLVSHGFDDDATTFAKELAEQRRASLFFIEDSLEDIVPNMRIRVVYNSFSSPIGSENKLAVFKNVIEWEPIGSSSQPEYVAANVDVLTEQDIVTAYEMCVRVLTDYYKAVWNGTAIDLDRFIENENLKQYMEKKVQLQHEKYGHLNDKVKNIEIIGAWKAELTDDADGGFLYLHLPVSINKYQGGFGEPTEFLVRNVDGKLVIVDWYTIGKDTYDFMVRGDNVILDDPEIWNDSEWVKTLGEKTD